MKVIVKTDTGLTFEHKAASKISVSSGLHVAEAGRERIYNWQRVLWVETDEDRTPSHKTVADLQSLRKGA